MHIRRDTQKRRNGTSTTYLSIAHNVTERPKGGKPRTKPIVFANLGDEEDLSPEMAHSMLKAFERYFKKRFGEEAFAAHQAEMEAEAKQLRVASPAFKILASRDLGMRLLVEGAWKDLGIGKALAAFEAKHKCEFPVERIVFAMVLNRLVDPKSKAACNDWCKQTGFVPEGAHWGDQYFYRALDVLHEHWEELEGLVAKCLWELLSPEERELQLVDTTSMYFESRQNDRDIRRLAEGWDEFDTDDEARAPKRPRPHVVNERDFRMQGHNKDGHPGDPQVVIASVCTPGGLVLRHQVFPGNTADVTVARALIATLPSLGPDEERVWVSDAGMLSKELLGLIDAAPGWKRVSAEPPRKSALGQSLLSGSLGRYRKHPRKPDFGYKVFDLSAEDSPSGQSERWVVTRNERDRERQLAKIDDHVERVKDELARQAPAHLAHAKAVCGVVAHQSLKKYVKPSEKVKGAYVLDQDAIARERLLAGVRFYRTTKLDWDGLAILDAYEALQDIESKHRQYKQVLELRPCYHRVERRIKAHVMLTVLAANCAYYLEKKTGHRIEKLKDLFANVVANELEEGSKRYWQRTELNKEQEEVLKRLGVRIPPRIWSTWIDAGLPTPKKGKAGTRAKPSGS